MKHKVSELEGANLNDAVALARGWELQSGHPESWSFGVGRDEWDWEIRATFEPSTDWAYGGPIIERERIEIHPRSDCGLGDHWGALTYSDPKDWGPMQRGTTPLIAAMRAFVASKLGDEVDLP